jgi:hypothetical protein
LRRQQFIDGAAADHVDRLTRKFVRWSLLLMFVDDRTAVAVVRHSPAIAEDLAAVAERYPWVAKFVDGAVSGGAAFGLVGSLGLLGMEGMAPGAHASNRCLKSLGRRRYAHGCVIWA